VAKAVTPKKAQAGNLLQILKERFEQFPHRHEGVPWAGVEAHLQNHAEALKVLQAMEDSGGEPDLVRFDKKSGLYTFMDCSAESPAGRRSLCYDQEGLDARKEFKPKDSAVNMARAMGARLLDEEEYRYLQTLGPFDTKTSSWIATPPEIRTLGGALFGDHRFGKVFVYHNTAPSYYGARGFRTLFQC